MILLSKHFFITYPLTYLPARVIEELSLLKRNNKGPLNKPRRVHFGVTEGPRGFPESWQSITMTINVFHDVMRVSRMFFLEKGNSALQNIQNHKSEGPCRAQ